MVPVPLLLQLEGPFPALAPELSLHRLARRSPVEDAHLRDLEVDRAAQLDVLQRDGREAPAPEGALPPAGAFGEAELRLAARLALRQRAPPPASGRFHGMPSGSGNGG